MSEINSLFKLDKEYMEGEGGSQSKIFRCRKRNIVFRNKGGGGGSKVVWSFSKSSSVLVNIGVPYAPNVFRGAVEVDTFFTMWMPIASLLSSKSSRYRVAQNACFRAFFEEMICLPI